MQKLVSQETSKDVEHAGKKIETITLARAHRMQALQKITRANISVNEFVEMAPCIDSISKDILSLGHIKQLSCQCTGLLL